MVGLGTTTGMIDWLDKVSSDHKFGSKDSYTKGNNNLDLTIGESLTLSSDVSGKLSIPAGTGVCIFRRYERHGGKIIATFFLGDSLVNVFAGGTWSKRSISRGTRL